MSVQVGPIGTTFRLDKALVEARCAAKIDRPRLKGKSSTLEGILSFMEYIYSTVVDTEALLAISWFVAPAQNPLSDLSEMNIRSASCGKESTYQISSPQAEAFDISCLQFSV
jgi:hypothetical protein